MSKQPPHTTNSSCVPTPPTAQLAVEVKPAGLSSLTLGSQKPGCVPMCPQESQTSHEAALTLKRPEKCEASLAGDQDPLKISPGQREAWPLGISPLYRLHTEDRTDVNPHHQSDTCRYLNQWPFLVPSSK